jgi:hypothetical protein
MNYSCAFIAVSPDCPASSGTLPPSGSVGGIQLALLLERPYGCSSDELLFEVYARRSGISGRLCEADRRRSSQIRTHVFELLRW